MIQESFNELSNNAAGSVTHEPVLLYTNLMYIYYQSAYYGDLLLLNDWLCYSSTMLALPRYEFLFSTIEASI